MSLDLGLAGQRVLVTGASQGIGHAAARALLEEGARVVINSSQPERLARAVEALSAFGPVHGIVADLRHRADLERLIRESTEHLGGLDVLVYVTGGPAPGRAMELDYAAWQRAAELLAVSPAYLSRLAAERMISNPRGGRIVLLGSLTMREPIPTLALSNVMRIPLLGLVRTLARELGPKQVRVNGILPGYIDTERVREIFEDTARREATSPAEVRGRLEREIPLGRLGAPAELARVIAFLASDASSYVTGSVLPVDGGILRSIG
ncbi:short-chain dehydrogenase/reductase SDR [mine drainage metagenome]|uniref:Short-chain dehydrogenase/reductase SDR n=1 Tax=mine drainage metagenome TaxID=410659 RepID=T0YEC4_9ZZZZ